MAQSDRLRHHDLQLVRHLNGRQQTRSQIMILLDIAPGEASARLSKMVRYGLIERLERGLYTTPSHVARLLGELKARMSLEEVQELLTRPAPKPEPKPEPAPEPKPDLAVLSSDREHNQRELAEARAWEADRQQSMRAHPAGSALPPFMPETTGEPGSFTGAFQGLLALINAQQEPGAEAEPEPEPESVQESALRHAIDLAGAMQLDLAHSNGEVTPAALYAMRRDLARLWVDIARQALDQRVMDRSDYGA
jgi:hypothetical protein